MFIKSCEGFLNTLKNQLCLVYPLLFNILMRVVTATQVKMDNILTVEEFDMATKWKRSFHVWYVGAHS